MKILGISAFYHDSAAALIDDGVIIAAAQEERFTRKKHDPGFPRCAIEYCLDEAGIEMKDVDYVAFYDKPFLKFERLLETYLSPHDQDLAMSVVETLGDIGDRWVCTPGMEWPGLVVVIYCCLRLLLAPLMPAGNLMLKGNSVS